MPCTLPPPLHKSSSPPARGCVREEGRNGGGGGSSSGIVWTRIAETRGVGGSRVAEEALVEQPVSVLRYRSYLLSLSRSLVLSLSLPPPPPLARSLSFSLSPCLSLALSFSLSPCPWQGFRISLLRIHNGARASSRRLCIRPSDVSH
jgi:hypothetical protein